MQKLAKISNSARRIRHCSTRLAPLVRKEEIRAYAREIDDCIDRFPLQILTKLNQRRGHQSRPLPQNRLYLQVAIVLLAQRYLNSWF